MMPRPACRPAWPARASRPARWRGPGSRHATRPARAAPRRPALARPAVRGGGPGRAGPSLRLAGRNQARGDGPADDPRFLPAIYATVRPRLAVTSVRVSSAGHPLALIRRADGRVRAAGQPGTLLGLFPDLDLHDTRLMLRAGASMILFTAGVTNAASHINPQPS